MLQRNIPHKSRHYQLRRINKAHVRHIIQTEGAFHGYICGNDIQQNHIAQSWNFGEEIQIDNLDEFNSYVKDFENVLFQYAPELGPRPSFYQIVSKRKPSRQGHKKYEKSPHHKIKEASS